LQPFEFGNDKYITEIMDKEFVKDHKIHDSQFHKECIEKWMKAKINQNCPICRKTLKQSFSILVKKKINEVFYDNPFLCTFFFIILWYSMLTLVGIRT